MADRVVLIAQQEFVGLSTTKRSLVGFPTLIRVASKLCPQSTRYSTIPQLIREEPLVLRLVPAVQTTSKQRQLDL